MADKVFDVRLIPEFNGAYLPIVEWMENVEYVCELRDMKIVKHC